jgi:hypothetical protein
MVSSDHDEDESDEFEAEPEGLRVQSLLLASGEPGGTFGEATSSLHSAPLIYRRAIAICR